MKKFYQLFFAIFIFVIGVLPVAAWDDAGHKTIAYIAWEQMTPAAREKVFEILMNAPEDSDLSVFYLQDSRSEAVKRREFFMIAATWADIVRDKKFENRFEKYHHSNWHYTDTFWTAENGAIKLLPKPEGEGGGMATEKINEFVQLLKTETAPDADQAIAIAWIEHLVGDIHQPLHNSARITDLEPKGDQGGNTFSLTPKDTPREKSENLHWFWDSILGRNIPRNDVCDSDYIVPIAETIIKKFPFAELQKRLEPDKIEQWHEESFKLATTDVFSTDLIRYETPTAKYRRNALRVSQEQMALAGYRLGALFNELFGGGNGAVDKKPVGECQIIRRVPYPITQVRVDQKMEIVLLDICPSNPGTVARPMLSKISSGGVETMTEYDIVRKFKNKKEAQDYAAANKISDVSF